MESNKNRFRGQTPLNLKQLWATTSIGNLSQSRLLHLPLQRNLLRSLWVGALEPAQEMWLLSWHWWKNPLAPGQEHVFQNGLMQCWLSFILFFSFFLAGGDGDVQGGREISRISHIVADLSFHFPRWPSPWQHLTSAAIINWDVNRGRRRRVMETAIAVHIDWFSHVL